MYEVSCQTAITTNLAHFNKQYSMVSVFSLSLMNKVEA